TAGAGWRDVRDAIARVAARPADRKGYVYALEDEIGTVSQERRAREASEAAGVSRAIQRTHDEDEYARTIGELRAKYPGATMREILRAEGLDPFPSRPL